VSPNQEIHHTLKIRITAHVCLCICDGGVAGRPSHAVTHEIDRSFQNVLSTVQQFLRLLGEGK
jgi:hypothetical protein